MNMRDESVREFALFDQIKEIAEALRPSVALDLCEPFKRRAEAPFSPTNPVPRDGIEPPTRGFSIPEPRAVNSDKKSEIRRRVAVV